MKVLSMKKYKNIERAKKLIEKMLGIQCKKVRVIKDYKGKYFLYLGSILVLIN